MPAFLRAGFLISAIGVAVVLLSSTVVYCDFPATLKLVRGFPASHTVELDALRVRDRKRHSRFLQAAGVVDFPVDGSSDPFTVGLYFTRVKLGTPPKEFYVQIDTGSDILWVACNPCDDCPKASGLGVPLSLFDVKGSSTASTISCSDERCTAALHTMEAGCSSQSDDAQCNYFFQYGDGSGTSGYYVSDTLYFETVVGEDSIVNSSTSVVFGCSNSQSGDLTKPGRAIDGIIGFGQHDLSVISQLSSRGVAPKVFSHCLKGSDNGGGILVLGEIVQPGIVYTPLVQSQPHYNLNLQSIAVNGQTLPINPAVFATSSNRGTIIDSGTTLAYLAEEAYDPFINAITSSVSQSVRSFLSKGSQCFVISNSVSEVFPSATLNFQGGASLILKPEDYLLQQGSVDGAMIWCIGWQKVQGQGITILGDIVLKDKIFVYDLAGQRIGWANYDCSLSVNVSSTSSGKNEFVNTGQLSVSSSSMPNTFYNRLRVEQTKYVPNGRSHEANSGSAILSAASISLGAGSQGSEMLSSMLAAASPHHQKQMRGELLFPLVKKHKFDLSAKITGTLLEMDNTELLLLLESSDSLAAKVEEAVHVLKLSEANLGNQDTLHSNYLSAEVAVN